VVIFYRGPHCTPGFEHAVSASSRWDRRTAVHSTTDDGARRDVRLGTWAKWLRDRLERTGVSECDWLENECGRSLATESADKKRREEELGRNAGNGGSVRILTDVDRNCTLNRPFCQFHSGPRKSGQTQYFCDFSASFHLSFDLVGRSKDRTGHSPIISNDSRDSHQRTV
jgi:hypothetical protein